MSNELIQQARELCEEATPGPWEVKVKGNTVESHQVMSPGNGPICSAISPKTKNAQFITASRFLVPQLCDTLEAAEKENEGLKNILQFNMVQIHGERMTVLDALSSLTARAEKAEAENRWIPVGERLPEDSEPVYAYCPTGRGSVEATMGMMVRAHKYSGYTHWMPRAVPEPPKGE